MWTVFGIEKIQTRRGSMNPIAHSHILRNLMQIGAVNFIGHASETTFHN
jgi:hypothetical protein